MERVIFLLAGYVLGLIQTGYIFGKTKNIDIREYGSGNAGATNTLRVLGKKAGFIVFLGDFLKALIPCLLVRYFFRSEPNTGDIYMLYTGFGVVLGHSYPFYLKFKGGKGVASIAGILTAVDLRITLVCLIVFPLIVALTRYVSLASIAVMFCFASMSVLFVYLNYFNLAGSGRIEFTVLACVIAIFSIYRHKSNIQRLFSGTENKINFKK